MVGDIPFGYEAGSGFLHRMNPAAKFLCLILLSAALMAGPPFLAALLAAFCAFLLLRMRVGIAELASKGRFLVALAAFVLVMKCVDPAAPFWIATAQVLPAAVYVAKLAILFVLAELFFRSTRMGALGASVSSLARFLSRKPGIDPGLYLGLAIEFMPRAFSAYRECAEAARARGFGNRRSSMRSAVSLIAAYLRLTIKKALWTAEALEARCYVPDRCLAAPPLRASDYLAVLFSSAFLFVSILQ